MGAVTSVLSPLMGVVGAVTGIFNDKAQYKAQAQIARNNAAIAENNAQDALAAGQREERRRRMQTAQQIGAARASVGASGFDVGAGSNLDEFASMTRAGEADALEARHTSQRQAQSYRNQATAFTNEANMVGAASKNALWSGIAGAGSSLLGVASAVDDHWYKPNSTQTQAAQRWYKPKTPTYYGA